MVYKYTLSVCLCIKNEAKYISIFLEHYIKQGVEHFYIVNNNSSDNIEEIINTSKYKNLITLVTDNNDYIIYNETCNLANIINNHYYDILKRETEWVIFVDIDEYMFGKNGYTLKTYVSSIPNDICSVYVIWNIINPAKDENGNILPDFDIHKSIYRVNYDHINKLSYEINNANKFGKSIIRTSMLYDNRKIWIHKNLGNGKVLLNYGIISNNHWDNSDPFTLSEEEYSKLNVTLHHYAIRNYDDYIMKKSHLNITLRNIFIKGLLDMIELDKQYLVEDKSITI